MRTGAKCVRFGSGVGETDEGIWRRFEEMVEEEELAALEVGMREHDWDC
jgi:hypothetical protein